VISIQNRVILPSSSVPMSSGESGLRQRKSGVPGVETQENLLAHPMVRVHRPPVFISYVLTRVGSTNVCSDGAAVLGAEQVHGPARRPGVQISVALLRQMPQMTRTRGTTTTFLAFCGQTMDMSLLIARDHEATTALTQTYRSSE
jgi:hypothetical protein